MKCLLSAGLNDNETPPPLPPRNPSMISDVDSSNSINKQMSFPLVSTCTPLMANCVSVSLFTVVLHTMTAHYRSSFV